MNERIQELARQATTIEHGVDNGFDRVTFDKEKFAELIVKECIIIVEEQKECLCYCLDRDYGYEMAVNDASKGIKQFLELNDGSSSRNNTMVW